MDFTKETPHLDRHAAAVVVQQPPMTASESGAPKRVRDRIAARLDDLGMTGRAFAAKLGKGDGWINGILTERNSLRLEHLDQAAEVLKFTPGDLVRRGNEAWDLNHHEEHLIRALRFLPPSLQVQIVTMTEYLVGVTPAEAELLRRLRTLDEDEKMRLFHGLDLLELLRPPSPKTGAIPDPLAMPPGSTSPFRRRRKR